MLKKLYTKQNFHTIPDPRTVSSGATPPLIEAVQNLSRPAADVATNQLPFSTAPLPPLINHSRTAYPPLQAFTSALRTSRSAPFAKSNNSCVSAKKKPFLAASLERPWQLYHRGATEVTLCCKQDNSLSLGDGVRTLKLAVLGRILRMFTRISSEPKLSRLPPLGVPASPVEPPELVEPVLRALNFNANGVTMGLCWGIDHLLLQVRTPASELRRVWVGDENRRGLFLAPPRGRSQRTRNRRSSDGSSLWSRWRGCSRGTLQNKCTRDGGGGTNRDGKNSHQKVENLLMMKSGVVCRSSHAWGNRNIEDVMVYRFVDDTLARYGTSRRYRWRLWNAYGREINGMVADSGSRLDVDRCFFCLLRNLMQFLKK